MGTMTWLRVMIWRLLALAQEDHFNVFEEED